jgi:hypothetical protein
VISGSSPVGRFAASSRMQCGPQERYPARRFQSGFSRVGPAAGRLTGLGLLGMGRRRGPAAERGRHQGGE